MRRLSRYEAKDAVSCTSGYERKNPSEAVNDLQPAAPPIEFGQIMFVINLSCLYPTYIRGEAYLANGRASKPPPSSRKSSTTAASSGTAGQERWRVWAWREPTRCKRKLLRAQMLMPPA